MITSTDREALTKLLAALTVESTRNDGACCDGRIPSVVGIDADVPWAWHREDCAFRLGHEALTRLLDSLLLLPAQYETALALAETRVAAVKKDNTYWRGRSITLATELEALKKEYEAARTKIGSLQGQLGEALARAEAAEARLAGVAS